MGDARALLEGRTVRDELVENGRFGTSERRFFLNNAAPVRNHDGSTIGGVVAQLDVTDRLAIEQALQTTEALLRIFFYFRGLMAFMVELRGRAAFCVC